MEEITKADILSALGGYKVPLSSADAVCIFGEDVKVTPEINGDSIILLLTKLTSNGGIRKAKRVPDIRDLKELEVKGRRFRIDINNQSNVTKTRVGIVKA